MRENLKKLNNKVVKITATVETRTQKVRFGNLKKKKGQIFEDHILLKDICVLDVDGQVLTEVDHVWTNQTSFDNVTDFRHVLKDMDSHIVKLTMTGTVAKYKKKNFINKDGVMKFKTDYNFNNLIIETLKKKKKSKKQLLNYKNEMNTHVFKSAWKSMAGKTYINNNDTCGIFK